MLHFSSKESFCASQSHFRSSILAQNFTSEGGGGRHTKCNHLGYPEKSATADLYEEAVLGWVADYSTYSLK
mgnify:CR=1 FL=1